MPEQPEKRLLARTSSFLHDLLPWESLRPGKETTAGGHFFSSENRITWNLGFRPRLDPLVHPVFCPCCNCGWWRTLGTASRPESLRGSCPSSQQPAAPQQPLITNTRSAPPRTLQPPDTSSRGQHPAWHLPPGTHKAGPGPAPGGANSWQAISQPGACPAALRGGGEARGGSGRGVAPARHLLPWPRDLKGGCKRSEGAGCQDGPYPAAVPSTGSHSPWPQSVPFKPGSSPPPPPQLASRELEVSQANCHGKTKLSAGGRPSLPGLPGPPPLRPFPDTRLPQPQRLWALGPGQVSAGPLLALRSGLTPLSDAGSTAGLQDSGHGALRDGSDR